VSEFYINPEWLTDLGKQYEPLVKAIQEGEPFARIQDIAGWVGPNFVEASGVARHAAQLAAAYAPHFAEWEALLGAMVNSEVAKLPEMVEAVSVATLTMPRPTISATGKAAEPTLMQQFFALPCGQRIAVIVIILSVALYLDLPTEVQDHIAGLITVLTAAMLMINKVTKK
jgi:hypothetical protein